MTDALEQVNLGDNWTPAQDQQVLTLKEQGFSYAQIAKLLPGRTERAIQARWRRLRDRRDDDAGPPAVQPIARAAEGGVPSPMVFREDADIVHVHTDQDSASSSRQPSVSGSGSSTAPPSTAPIFPRSHPSKKPKYLDPMLHQQAPPRGGMRMADLDVTSTQGYRKLLVKPTNNGSVRSAKSSPAQATGPAPAASDEANWTPQPKVQKDWTAEEDSLLLILKDQNLPFDQIAARLHGRSMSAIENRYSRIKDRQPEAPQVVQTPTPAEASVTTVSGNTPKVDDSILELSTKHWTDKAIGKVLGMSTDDVRTRRLDLRSARVSSIGKRKSEVTDTPPEKVRMRRRWSLEEDAKLQMLKSTTDLTWPQIAEQFPDRTVKGLTEHWSDLKGSGKLKHLSDAANGAQSTPRSEPPTSKKPRSSLGNVKNGTTGRDSKEGTPKRTGNVSKKGASDAPNAWNAVNKGSATRDGPPVESAQGDVPMVDAVPPTKFVHTVFVGNQAPVPASNLPIYRLEVRPNGLSNQSQAKGPNGVPAVSALDQYRAATAEGLSASTSLYGDSYETLPKPGQWAKKNGGVPGFFTTDTYQTFYKTYKATPLPPRTNQQQQQQQQQQPPPAPQQPPPQQQPPPPPPPPPQALQQAASQPATPVTQPIKRVGLASLLNPEITPTPPPTTPWSAPQHSTLDRGSALPGPPPGATATAPFFSQPIVSGAPPVSNGMTPTPTSTPLLSSILGPTHLPAISSSLRNSLPALPWANGVGHQSTAAPPPPSTWSPVDVANAADAAAIASLPAHLRDIRPWDILKNLEGKDLTPADIELYAKAVSVLSVMSRVTVSNSGPVA